MLKAAFLGVFIALAALLGLGVAAGYSWPLLALGGAAGLVALGAALPLGAVRAVILGALLLVPDVASGHSWGLLVRWSQGLTWSNFVVPALALPLLAGAWLAGGHIQPAAWPPLARRFYRLLAWCGLTLLLPWGASQLSGGVESTLVAHLLKLVFFIWIGVVLAGGVGRDGAGWLRPVLFWSIVANAIFGLGQAAGWLPVFSPLAQSATGPRATGFFYDANLYGVLAAWALLWVLCDGDQWGTPGQALLALAVAGNLIAAGSRAGFLAFGAGCAVLLLYRRWRTVGWAAVAMVGLALLFPVRSWQRVQSAVETMAAVSSPGPVPAADDAGTAERLSSMAQSLEQISAHPLFGLGFGRALYLGVPVVGSGAVRVPEQSFNGAQNMLLTVLAGTGPIGLLLFLATIAAPLRHPHSPGKLAMLAGFVGLLAACSTIEALWNTRLLALTVLLTAGVLFQPGAAGEEVAA